MTAEYDCPETNRIPSPAILFAHSNVHSGELSYKTWVHLPPKNSGHISLALKRNSSQGTLSLGYGCAILRSA
jgi:hypothetical protein